VNQINNEAYSCNKEREGQRKGLSIQRKQPTTPQGECGFVAKRYSRGRNVSRSW
jgi:hypothetical protein